MGSEQLSAAAAGAAPEGGPVFTLAEVAKRNSSREAWLVIHGRVYDVGRFLGEVRPAGPARGHPREVGRPGPARSGTGGLGGGRGGRWYLCPQGLSTARLGTPVVRATLPCPAETGRRGGRGRH